MVTQPKESVTLSIEQLLALQEFNKRLETYHAETRIANEKLEGIKAETIIKENHLLYFVEREKILEKSISNLIEKEAALKAHCAESTQYLSDNLKIITERNVLIAQEKEELAEAKKDHAIRLETIESKEKIHNEKNIQLEHDQLKVEESKKILQEAIAKI